MRRRWFVALVLATGLWTSSSSAQLRVRPIADETGEVALQLMFRKLRAAGTFMAATAHPDDENSSLIANMAYGHGLRAVLVTATRGDGGQNEIGPEIFDALAVLRTEELMAVHRFDGAEQLFTRAVDFGYSFSIDETYEKWGRDEIIGDFVHQIRAVRPDVIVGFLWDGTSGGLHHQASTHLVAEAFRAAADPSRYPDQIRAGLRPWQAKKFYYTASFQGAPPAGSLAYDGTEYDPLLSKTYDEIGVAARSMHKCQGTTQLLSQNNPAGARAYKLQDTVLPGQMSAKESSVLDGIDVTLMGLSAYAGDAPPAALSASLKRMRDLIDTAAAAPRGVATVRALAQGLREVRTLRSALASLGLGESARYELDFRLGQKERQFQDAVILAASVRVTAVADDPIVTPGQPVNLSTTVVNHGAVALGVRSITASGVTSPTACTLTSVAASTSASCNGQAHIPADAKSSDVPFKHEGAAARYVFDPAVPFGAPFVPTPFRARVGLTIADEPIDVELPFEVRDGTDVFAGEKGSEMLVVPALTLAITPDVIVVPTSATQPHEVRVTVRNNASAAATGTVALHAPAGWGVTPKSVAVAIPTPDTEQTVRFMVSAPIGARPGAARIHADISTASASFTTGYQVIEYPHIRRRLLFHDADVPVKLVNVKVAPRTTVGYVMGVGDQVPQAIAQLGVPVTLIGPDELAWGNLSKYTVIMTGVRAYERRPDLRANNARLIAYARSGGVVLVNYNKTEFNQAQYGPYPAQTTTNRITDEHAPVRVLVPAHPVFTTPNVIGPATWADWVQERGTYFLGQLAPQYVDLIEMTDPFPNNAGPKRGALVDAKIGTGHWVYIGLVLWRELPAGVPGAYQLLANLVSLR